MSLNVVLVKKEGVLPLNSTKRILNEGSSAKYSNHISVYLKYSLLVCVEFRIENTILEIYERIIQVIFTYRQLEFVDISISQFIRSH